MMKKKNLALVFLLLSRHVEIEKFDQSLSWRRSWIFDTSVLRSRLRWNKSVFLSTSFLFFLKYELRKIGGRLNKTMIIVKYFHLVKIILKKSIENMKWFYLLRFQYFSEITFVSLKIIIFSIIYFISLKK